MADEEKILDNYVEGDFTIEYLFVEKAEKQIKPINDDQGYLMGFFNIFITGKFQNNNIDAFRKLVLFEINYSLKTYDHFKSESLNLNEYKFGLVDNEKNIVIFEKFDENFYENLVKSLRNLMIAGKNFDFERFKDTEIFDEWFEKYCNRS